MPQLARAAAPPTAVIPFLRSFHLFRDLDDHTLGLLSAQARRQIVVRGAFLAGDGPTDGALYAITTGDLALYGPAADAAGGRDIAVNVLGAGDVLGLLPFEAQALCADAVLYHLPLPLVDQIAADHPGLAAALRAALCAQLASSYRRHDACLRHNARTRLARTLARLARRQGREVTATHRELATLVGTRQDEVSRLVGYLSREGLVAKRPRRPGLMVLDTARLAAS